MHVFRLQCRNDLRHATSGVHGKADGISRWKYQTCSGSVSERKFTSLYHLKTPFSRISLVMSLPANRLDPLAAACISPVTVSGRSAARGLAEGTTHRRCTMCCSHSLRVA
jgi:hypothetical protein